MALDTRFLLSDLIRLGPDAYSNLFKITMTGTLQSESLNIITGRTTTFNGPQRDSVSKEIPYQNVNIQIPSPGTQLPRNSELTMRIDSGYKSYELLRSLQLINHNGFYEKDPNKKITKMHVVSYQMEPQGLVPVYEWNFYNLYLITVSKLTYTYDSSSNLTTNISFIWEKYDEGIPKNT